MAYALLGIEVRDSDLTPLAIEKQFRDALNDYEHTDLQFGISIAEHSGSCSEPYCGSSDNGNHEKGSDLQRIIRDLLVDYFEVDRHRYQCPLCLWTQYSPDEHVCLLTEAAEAIGMEISIGG